MVTKTAAILISGALLAGCAGQQVPQIPHTPYSPVPVASNFPTSNQYTLQAAAHWGVIAQHIEKGLAADLKKSPPRPFYIAEPSPQASPFQRALAAQLVSALVRDGHIVSRTPAGSLKVDIDVQAYTFAPGRAQFRYPGEPTVLTAGVLALTLLEPVAGLLAGVAAIDTYQYQHAKFAAGDTPQTELLVTVSVSDQYRYYARNSTAYYVADSDRTLYGIAPDVPAEAKLMKTYKVKGDQ
ncbi:hypothetical protein ASD15_13790 [Massilia sp. Root351]|jgi:hypothetical protein|uniref:hypothetical protein n=1 Tax=Massilia sp. Root351 TaxID=1736522 RepID=UPI000708F3E7|nr:hypothetical protein [Massilia sp. Root351]KQV80954.1 hypothetical protein ASD15_13790 [Massilia sp. Root351]